MCFCCPKSLQPYLPGWQPGAALPCGELSVLAVVASHPRNSGRHFRCRWRQLLYPAGGISYHARELVPDPPGRRGRASAPEAGLQGGAPDSCNHREPGAVRSCRILTPRRPRPLHPEAVLSSPWSASSLVRCRTQTLAEPAVPTAPSQPTSCQHEDPRIGGPSPHFGVWQQPQQSVSQPGTAATVVAAATTATFHC